MNGLRRAYARGQWDALRRFKIAAAILAPTSPTVRDSGLLRSHSNDPSPEEQQRLQAPTHPEEVKRIFDATEQSRTRLEPLKKIADDLCTTCREPKHYGPCLKPKRTKPDGAPLKTAGFNAGLTADDPNYATTGEDGPSTSPHYHAATTADSSLARARDGRPADEQAATGFADLFRHLGIQAPADEWANASGALVKTQAWNLPGAEGHSLFERRGPTVNPYEERLTIKSPPVGWGDEGKQRIDRAFDQIDDQPDSTVMEGTWGGPATGPAVSG